MGVQLFNILYNLENISLKTSRFCLFTCICNRKANSACLRLENIQRVLLKYGKCSKILNTSCLPKMPRTTVQTQVRLLLKKQSDQGLTCLLF